MLKSLSHTKLIVIIGYFVLICLAALGIILIYIELLNFSKINEPSAEREELVSVSNILATMYQAEGTAGLLTITAVPALKQEYDSLMNNAFTHITLLKNVSDDPKLNSHLDSVSVLLAQKRANILRMVQLLDSIESKTIKEISKSTVLSKKDMDDLNHLLVKKTQQFEDTVVVKAPPKKSFIRRMRDAFKPNSQDSTTRISKNTIENFGSVVVPTLTDTIAEYINDVYAVTQKRNASIVQRLVNRQNQLYRTNEKLTTQINQIMREIEKREFVRSLNLSEAKSETLKRSSQIISIIGILALMIVIIFLTLALRSISVGQRLQKEIEKAKKYAENLLSSREQLLLTITHDIKAPVSSIIGFIELLLKDKPIKKEAYYIENMLHSAEHVMELVKNLLDYHALESGKQSINLMAFSPSILTKDIYQSFVPLADRKNLDFRFKCNGNKNTTYLSDPYLIRQIANNLVSNAIKFTPPNGLVVFSVFTEEENGQTIFNLSVADNGPGIKDENKTLLFEEFRRLDTSVEGSGLGLPITHRLVQLLGGKMQIKSELNKGSEFIVKIPLTPEKDNIPNPSFKIENDHKCIDVDINKKILFIDDDVVQLNLFSELLRREGFSPVICSNSAAAFDLLQKNHFDIVFSDIQMPNMNGFGLIERIRMSTFKNSSTIPVIALSASSDISEQKFKDAGFSGFLAKPFTAEQLFHIIEQFIGNQSCKKGSYSEEKGFHSLIEFASDDKAAAAAIVQSFIDDNNKNIETLKKAFKEDDWATIEQISHKMLPIIRMIGNTELISILHEFEKGHKVKSKAPRFLSLIELQIKKAEEFKEIYCR